MIRHIIPTKHYFTTIFGISCALLLVFSLVIYRESTITEARSEWVIKSYETLRHARIVMTQVLNVETGQRGYLLSGSPKYLEPYKAAEAALADELNVLASMTEDNAQQVKNVAELRAKVMWHSKLMARHLVKFLHSNKHALSISDLEESRRAMDDVRNSMNKVVETERTLLNERMIDARSQQKNYIRTLIVGTGLGLGALAIANLIIFSLLARSKRMESELMASEDRFALVVNGLNDGIYDYNPITHEVYFSPSYKRMLGYSDEELPNTIEMQKSLIHPDDVEQVWKVFHQYERREIPQYMNFMRVRHKDGSWRWHMSRGVGMWDRNGVMYRIMGSHTDVTQQKEREEDLKQLNADLEGFTYIASHDLRAPLVNLKGFAGEISHAVQDVNSILIPHLKELPEKEREIIAHALETDVPEALVFINSAVERMDTLTTAILDMSRIGRREYKFEVTDTQQIVQRCLNVLAHEISLRKVTVHCTEMPVIVTDALALEQIFGNILDNAIKYLDPERPGQITIAAHPFLTEILFSVSDNGIGIASLDTQKVFEIFRRAGNSGNVRGTGMGMAYVKAMLRKLGGRIWFESELNKGTTFHFALPTRPKKEQA